MYFNIILNGDNMKDNYTKFSDFNNAKHMIGVYKKHIHERAIEATVLIGLSAAFSMASGYLGANDHSTMSALTCVGGWITTGLAALQTSVINESCKTVAEMQAKIDNEADNRRTMLQYFRT